MTVLGAGDLPCRAVRGRKVHHQKVAANVRARQVAQTDTACGIKECAKLAPTQCRAIADIVV